MTGLYRNACTQTVTRCLQRSTKFYFYTQIVIYFFIEKYKIFTEWKVFKYGVFSGPYFPVFGRNTEIDSVKSPYSVRVQEYRDQKKLCFWTLFTQCLKTVLQQPSEFFTQTYSQISIHFLSTKNKSESCLKQPFVFWLYTTKIKLNSFIVPWTFHNLKKKAKLLAHLFQNVFENGKKRIHFFRSIVRLVVLVLRPLTELPSSYCKWLQGIDRKQNQPLVSTPYCFNNFCELRFPYEVNLCPYFISLC